MASKYIVTQVDPVGGGTVTSVNGVMPNGGDVELTAVISHPNKNILLRVGNQDFATLECMTEQDANDIIDSFTLQEVLNVKNSKT